MSQVKRSKYRNVKTVVDNITFDSKKEANRYCELRLLERAGAIDALTIQVPYSLIVKGTSVGKYIADFYYLDNEKHSVVVEDCKGIKTAVYRLKKKLMKAIYGIEILET